jgi:hypothetical protein
MTGRRWKYLAGTYLVFYVVIIAMEGRGFERGPMSPIDRILTAPILWGFAAYGAQRGRLMGRIYGIDRSQYPIGFWSLITFELLFGFFFFCWGLRDALR